ncbi:MAG: hypothetical protein M3Q06_10900 [Bacteroidota bacterium]|nr:hypothetical protein [Bacteroidota bacterium]
MDEPLHEDEQLLRYLDGEMEPEEQRRFETALAADGLLRQRMEALQLAIEGVQQVGTTLHVQRIHAEMRNVLQMPKKVSPVRRMVRRSLSIAAGILLLTAAIGGWWLYHLTAKDLYSAHYIDYTVGISRGEGDSAALFPVHYRNGEYTRIVQASGTANLSPQDSLLTGLANLQIGQAAEAIRWFSALQKEGSIYHQDADYYLAMAYLQNNEPRKAETWLKQIKENPQHLYRNQVSSGLLWKVRMLQWK